MLNQQREHFYLDQHGMKCVSENLLWLETSHAVAESVLILTHWLLFKELCEYCVSVQGRARDFIVFYCGSM